MSIQWFGIPHDRFEEIIAALMRAMGYENVVVRTGGTDKGWDIDAQIPRNLPDGTKQLETWRVECKRYRGKLSAVKIRDHYQRMAKTPPIPAYLLFVTTYGLSNPSKEDLTSFAEVDRVNVRWWERQQLEELIQMHMDDISLRQLIAPYFELTLDMDIIRKACNHQVAVEIERRVGRKYLPSLFRPRPIKNDVNRFIKADLQVIQLRELSKLLKESNIPNQFSLNDEIWTDTIRAVEDARTWSEAEICIQNLVQKTTDKIRDPIRQAVDGVRALQRNCFLIRDKAGSGKTNLLCRLATEHRNTKTCSLFLSCRFDLPETRSLEDVIAGSLRVALEDQRNMGYTVPLLPEKDQDLMQAVFLSIQKEEDQVVVFLDGINENRDLRALDEAMLNLLTNWNSAPVKFVVTCRDIFWSYFSEVQWSRFLFDEQSHALGEFGQNEIDKVIEVYFHAFKISGRLTGVAREKCRHPLLLRFFCEAHTGRNIREFDDLRLKDLFDEYWIRKQQEIAEALDLGSDGGMRVEAFLFKIVYHMSDRFATQVTLGELSALTGETDLESNTSLYKRLLDQDVIIEELPPNDALDSSYQARRISFVYDEFYDYMMALAYVRRRDWDHRDPRDICIDLVSLIQQSTDFEQLRGVVEYLILIAERKDMHQVLCATLARLGNYEILCSVLPKLKGDTSWMGGVLRACLLAIGASELKDTVKKATGWQPAYDELVHLIRQSETQDLFEVLAEGGKW